MPSSAKARDPKAVMKIETLNATFQPAKIGNPCGLQITYLRDNSTRNIFVYHSDAKVQSKVRGVLFCFFYLLHSHMATSLIFPRSSFKNQTYCEKEKQEKIRKSRMIFLNVERRKEY